MSTRIKALSISISAALALCSVSAFVFADDTPQTKPDTAAAKPNAQQSHSVTLDDASRAALLKAIENEREGIRFYSAVVEKHGDIRPFAPMLQAEKHHEAELLNVAKRFALDVPSAADEKKPSVPESVTDACAAAVKWEQDTASLLNRLSGDVTRPGLKNTLTRLATTATDRHRPPFEKCVKLGGALPQKVEAPPRCDSCGMVGCGCSHESASAESAVGTAAANTAAANTTSEGQPKPASGVQTGSCGCKMKQQ